MREVTDRYGERPLGISRLLHSIGSHDFSNSVTFIIDPEGILRYMVVSDLNVGRSVKETLRVIKALKTGELCQIGWEDGEDTLGKA